MTTRPRSDMWRESFPLDHRGGRTCRACKQPCSPLSTRPSRNDDVDVDGGCKAERHTRRQLVVVEFAAWPEVIPFGAAWNI